MKKFIHLLILCLTVTTACGSEDFVDSDMDLSDDGIESADLIGDPNQQIDPCASTPKGWNCFEPVITGFSTRSPLRGQPFTIQGIGFKPTNVIPVNWIVRFVPSDSSLATREVQVQATSDTQLTVTAPATIARPSTVELVQSGYSAVRSRSIQPIYAADFLITQTEPNPGCSIRAHWDGTNAPLTQYAFPAIGASPDSLSSTPFASNTVASTRFRGIVMSDGTSQGAFTFGRLSPINPNPHTVYYMMMRGTGGAQGTFMPDGHYSNILEHTWPVPPDACNGSQPPPPPPPPNSTAAYRFSASYSTNCPNVSLDIATAPLMANNGSCGTSVIINGSPGSRACTGVPITNGTRTMTFDVGPFGCSAAIVSRLSYETSTNGGASWTNFTTVLTNRPVSTQSPARISITIP